MARQRIIQADKHTDKNFEHSREWIEKRLLMLAKIFCIDVCAYAIMSNHYHVVLHINREDAESLSLENVAERWLSLHSGPVLVNRFMGSDIAIKAALPQLNRKRISGLRLPGG